MLLLLHCRQKSLKIFCLGLIFVSTSSIVFISGPGFTGWLKLQDLEDATEDNSKTAEAAAIVHVERQRPPEPNGKIYQMKGRWYSLLNSAVISPSLQY